MKGMGLSRWARFMVVGLAGVGLMTGCGKSAEEKARDSAKVASLVAEAMKSTVTYYVEGSTSQASITMQTPTGSSQQSDVDVPLTRKSDGREGISFVFRSGDFVYISAQNSESTGTVRCRIVGKDGEVVSENVASGGYAIATCKGRAP